MGVVILAAVAVAAGAPLAVVAVVVGMSFVSSQLAIVALVVAVSIGLAQKWRGRTKEDVSEGGLLRLLGGRVSAGASIRSAIADRTIEGIPSRARRLAQLGQPMADVGGAMVAVLPANGRAFRAICAFSEYTGAAVSAALEILADQAGEVAQLARERRVSLAQVKLSAVVVGIVPMVVSVALVAVRGVPDPGGALVVIPMIVGLSLQLVGVAIVFAVAGRSVS